MGYRSVVYAPPLLRDHNFIFAITIHYEINLESGAALFPFSRHSIHFAKCLEIRK